jgi:hypothetical protein
MAGADEHGRSTRICDRPGGCRPGQPFGGEPCRFELPEPKRLGQLAQPGHRISGLWRQRPDSDMIGVGVEMGVQLSATVFASPW